MAFVSIAKIGDLPKGGMKGFSVNGKKILLADVDGKVCAMGAVCTHLGGPLDKGRLEDGKIVCPWHGSIFDAKTGKSIGGPAKKDVEKFDVKVEKGEIFVGL